MNRQGVLRCLIAAALFGAAAPAAAQLTGDLHAFALAGLLYLGAALAVLPAVIRRPPSRRAIRSEWRPAFGAVLVGGAIAPVLLMAGLERTNAASASLLLNTELVATVVFAAIFFREHIGPRVLASAAIITTASVVLTWQPGTSISAGAILVVAACAAWGLDNCITANIQQVNPEHIVALKGLVAGSANLAIGLTLTNTTNLDLRNIALALAVGAAGYGLSITLWVKGARDLGAARAQVVFATAPFIGATVAWTVFNAPIETAQIVAALLAAIGVTISLHSHHTHPHNHKPLTHTHEHRHDDGHHDHGHDDTGRHTHEHTHCELVHAHPHVPDLHHHHDHADH